MTSALVAEDDLPKFRADHLSADFALARLPGSDGVLLFNEPPGIGKSTLARSLIPSALAAGRDLVILVAPTRAILAEMPPADELGVDPAAMVRLEARPTDRCGPLDQEWSALERQGCAALARDQLCGGCPHAGNCTWPDQLDQIGEQTRVILLTEQYLVLNPTMIPSLISRAGAEAPLVILDEGLFLTRVMHRRITRSELGRFAETLEATTVAHGMGQAAVDRLLHDVALLLDQDVDIDSLPRFYTGGLEHAVLAVQETGRRLFGANYRHLVPDLALLNSHVTRGQWIEAESFEVSVRIDLGAAEAVVLGPYLAPELVEERLQRDVVIANRGQVFRHSGSRFVNVRDAVGSARSMGHEPHRRRVVDTIAALALRNALRGRRTVLVARKKYLGAIKARIESLTRSIDHPLNVHLPTDMPREPTPWDVQLINYGIVGINSMKDYDAIYCVGAYNADPRHLAEVYHQDLPPGRHEALCVRTIDRRRCVQSTQGTFSGRFHAGRAQALLETLERRVVLQAVGRARPFTSPTEVLLFQQDRFDDIFGEIEIFETLGVLRRQWSIPTAAEMARSALGDRMRKEREAGASFRELASRHGVSVSTAHKALKMPSLTELLRRVGQ